MKQSKYITEVQNKYFNAGLDTGEQLTADLFEVAMHECGINPLKIGEVAQRALELNKEYECAIDVKRNVEADVKQHHLDEKLKAIFAENFRPWELRYPWIRRVRY